MPAAPTVLAVANASSGTGGAAGTVVWTVPTVQTGDFAVLITAQSGAIAVSSVSDGAATWTVATPGTWPLVNGNGINATCYTAPLTPADSGTTLTLTWSGTQRDAGLLIIVRGSAQRIDVVAVAQRTASTTNTAVTGPTYTPLGNDSLALAVTQAQSFANGTAVTVTPDAAYTEPTNGDVSDSPAAAICVGCEVAWKALSGQAGVSQGAYSATTGVATARYNAIVLVIPPIDPPPPVPRRRGAQRPVRPRGSQVLPPVPQPAPIASPMRPARKAAAARTRPRTSFVPPAAAAIAAPAMPPQPQPHRKVSWWPRRRATPSIPAAPTILVVPPSQPVTRRRGPVVRGRRSVQPVPLTQAPSLPAVARPRRALWWPRRARTALVPPAAAVVAQPAFVVQPQRDRVAPQLRRRPAVAQVPVPASVVTPAVFVSQPQPRRYRWLPARRRSSATPLQPAVQSPASLPPQPQTRRRPWVVARRRGPDVVKTGPVVPTGGTRRRIIWPRRRPALAQPPVPAAVVVVQPPLVRQPQRRRWSWIWPRRHRRGQLPPSTVAAPVDDETTVRPFDGTTGRPNDGTTARTHAVTTRPNDGTTHRPFDGITPDP